MLDTVAGYVLGETESGAAINAVRDVGAVGAHGIGEVLDGERGVGKELLLTQHGTDLMHQFIGLFGGGSVFLRFFDGECLLRHGGMRGYVSEGEEEDGHHERGYADEQAAVEQFASEHIEKGGDNGGETDEQE